MLDKEASYSSPKVKGRTIGLTFDEAVAITGGFGKKLFLTSCFLGFLHAYSYLFLTLTIVSNSFLFYALPFLELYPEYICPPEMPKCDHRDRCRNRDLI